MKRGLFASLKFIGSNLDVRRNELQHISLKPCNLAEGIDSFCGKVRSAIDAILSVVQLKALYALILPQQTINLGYRHHTSMIPSQSLKQQIDKLIDDIVRELEKDLCRAIIHSLEYQFQNLCYFQEIQVENEK